LLMIFREWYSLAARADQSERRRILAQEERFAFWKRYRARRLPGSYRDEPIESAEQINEWTRTDDELSSEPLHLSLTHALRTRLWLNVVCGRRLKMRLVSPP
jgi:hypothetical protein